MDNLYNILNFSPSVGLAAVREIQLEAPAQAREWVAGSTPRRRQAFSSPNGPPRVPTGLHGPSRALLKQRLPRGKVDFYARFRLSGALDAARQFPPGDSYMCISNPHIISQSRK